MKQFVINVVGILLIISIFIWQLYDSVTYFAKNITDLIYVFAIALVGGIAFWRYSKFSPSLQHRVGLFLLGLIASVSSCLCVLLLSMFVAFWHDSFLSEVKDMFSFLGVIAFNVVCSCYIWWRFYRMLKRCQ
jgi:hypothetical protein